MASTIESHNPQQYVDFDEYIDYQLQRTRGNIKTTDILTAFAFVAVFVLAYLLLFVIGDHWLVEGGFSQATRIALLSMVGILSLGWLGWKVLWPYLRQVNALFAAKVIERSQPELRSTLLNLIDARANGKELSPAILSAMEKRAALSISQTNVDEAVDRRPLMWACYTVLGLVVLFSLYTIFTPKKVSASVLRALFPVASVEAPTQTVIERVDPGDVEVIPGTRLEVLADISGDVPEKVILNYSTADREFVDEPIEMREVPDVPRRYRALIIGTNGEGIQQNLTYHIQAGDDHSSNYAVKVFQPPTVNIVELHSSYPNYMGREAKARHSGRIDDYEGVIVTFLAEGNMPLSSATITFHDDHGTNFRAESIPMHAIDAERTRFRARWVLSIRAEDGIYPRYYTIECKNERGQSDPNPTRYPIRIHPDQRPEVKILHPQESHLERPANAVLPVTAFASDDFKVKSLTLWKQVNDQPPVKHATLFEGAKTSFSIDYDWRLNADWSLKAGDKVSYWAQAEDNREPDAGKRNTDKYTVLITPEQTEESVQKQLQSDRQEQKQEENKTESSEKNAEDTPQQTNPRPQADEEMQKEQPQEKPMPQNGEEQKDQSQQEGGTENPSQSQPQEGQGKTRSEQKGNGGEPVKNDGSQDGKALESLHEHLNKNKPEPGEDNQNPENKNEDPGSETNTGEERNQNPNNDGNKPNQTPENTPEQPKGSNKTETPNDTTENKAERKPESDPPNNPEATEKGTETDQNNPPMPNGSENKQGPNEKQPGAEKTEKSESGSNENKPADNSKKPDENKEPGNETKPEPKTPEGTSAEGGADQKMGEGTPSNPSDPSASKQNKGTGGDETMPDENAGGRDAEKPFKGSEKPTGPDKNAEQRPATGKEKGPATKGDDPNAEAKPAKNNLERTDTEKPATTRKREGGPENVPDKVPNQASEEKTPDKAKPGSESSKPADPKNQTPKPDTNPEERPSQSPEADPNQKKPAPSAEQQPNVGEDGIKGKGEKDQQAKRPDGGEGGRSKQEQQGTPGGKEKGPGDKTPRPGNTETAPKPNGGESGDERGEGTRTRPTDRTNEVPQNGNPADNTEAQEAPTADEPGEGPAPSAGERNGERSTENPTGESGPPSFDPGKRSSKPPMTPEAAQAAEEQNLEYGRQATDLALKKLENELKRGEVNEDWLKEMGWDEADAAKFLDRMKDRLDNRDANTPEALAKQRQFNEWLKRLNKPTNAPARRTGSAAKNESARDLFNTRRAAPPAELRDLYEAYQRGISERSK